MYVMFVTVFIPHYVMFLEFERRSKHFSIIRTSGNLIK